MWWSQTFVELYKCAIIILQVQMTKWEKAGITWKCSTVQLQLLYIYILDCIWWEKKKFLLHNATQLHPLWKSYIFCWGRILTESFLHQPLLVNKTSMLFLVENLPTPLVVGIKIKFGWTILHGQQFCCHDVWDEKQTRSSFPLLERMHRSTLSRPWATAKPFCFPTTPWPNSWLEPKKWNSWV